MYRGRSGERYNNVLLQTSGKHGGGLSLFEALFHFTGVRFDNKLDWDKNTTALYRSVPPSSSLLLARAAHGPRLDPQLLVAITHLPFITCDWSWHFRRKTLQLVQEYEKESSKLVD